MTSLFNMLQIIFIIIDTTSTYPNMAQALKEIIYGEPVDKNRPVDNHSPQNSVSGGVFRILEEPRGDIL